MTQSESSRILLLEQGERKKDDSQSGINSPNGKNNLHRKLGLTKDWVTEVDKSNCPGNQDGKVFSKMYGLLKPQYPPACSLAVSYLPQGKKTMSGMGAGARADVGEGCSRAQTH